MRYLVGNDGSGKSVFQLSGSEAVNLTGLAPEVGSDLMKLIGDPTLQERMAAGWLNKRGGTA